VYGCHQKASNLPQQPRVFAAGRLETFERRIGAFPECEEVFVGAAGRVDVSRKRIRTRAPEMRERVERRGRRQAAMIENRLKLLARTSRVFLLKECLFLLLMPMKEPAHGGLL